MENTELNIKQIYGDEEKETIARMILESLPDWFGIPEAREEYIAESKGTPFFCALDGETVVGFLYLKETGRHTVELAVMGVRKEYHRKGIGGMLFDAAKKTAKQLGYSFIQVKTVQMGKYAEYDDTNRFYLSLGFKELEVFPTLWDEWNPCQIYIMAI
ncbi:GNAT family N-acetyltransferase [Pseudoflavonifractor sp. An85]|nr:GNAT family N-acetyltransferase [Pseudoflavonifractor sp. An85]OUN21450.1 GNAT family N-acetyltransferase [Pseudoflavonifractor sp. An85]